MNLRPQLPVLVVGLALVTGCGGPGPGPGDGSSVTTTTTATAGQSGTGMPELVGRTFVSTRVTVDGATHALVPGTRITLGISADRISIEAGCNTVSGRITIDGPLLRPVGTLVTTAMPCPSALSAQDRWLTDLFTTGVQVGLKDGLLTLTRGGTTISLQDQKNGTARRSQAPLVMTRWTLATIVQGDVARSVPAGATSTLAFGSGLPKAFIDTGCNTGSAEVLITPDRITFSAPTLTERGCAGDAALLEATVRDVVQGTVAYRVQDRLLTVTTGTTSLVYRAG
jgi:heat shock protein HslJ